MHSQRWPPRVGCQQIHNKPGSTLRWVGHVARLNEDTLPFFGGGREWVSVKRHPWKDGTKERRTVGPSMIRLKIQPPPGRPIAWLKRPVPKAKRPSPRIYPIINQNVGKSAVIRGVDFLVGIH